MLKFSKHKIGKRALSAFLCAMLSFSNVQAVAYAGEVLGEEFSIAEEKSSESGNVQKEEGTSKELENSEEQESSNEQEFSNEQESSNEFASLTKSEEESVSLDEIVHGDQEEISSLLKENAEAEAKAIEKQNTGEEISFLEPGEFQDYTSEGVFVSAKYGEDTFPEGTFMKLRPIEDEEILSAMKDKVKQEKEKKLKDGREVEIRSAYFVDISFYRVNKEGEEIEVQPKKGKSVEVVLKKNLALEEVLSLKPGVWVEEYVEEEEMKKEKSFFKKDAYSISLPESEELTVVHLPEGKNAEIIPVKDAKDSFSFKGRHFSPHGLITTGTGTSEAAKPNHVFRGFWREKNDPKAGQEDADTGHSYSDETDGDIRKQKNLKITPPDKNSNRLDKSTLVVEFTLKGNKDTVYPVGSVTMDIPASIFESWNGAHPTTVAYDRNASTEYPSVKSGIPEAPKTNTLSDFNYTLIEKTVDGKQVKYYHLKNHKPLPGGMTFTSDFEYSMVPSMVKVEHKQVDGVELGEYYRSLPLFATVDHPDDQYDASVQDDLSLLLRTKVNPLKMRIKHGTSGVNGGIFYNWDSAWGPKPSDADNYFYVPWFIDVERARGSSQGFDYNFTLNPTTPDGGELIGAQKAYQSYDWNSYIYPSYLDVYTKSGIYKDITQYKNTAPDSKEYWKTYPVGRKFIGIDKEPIKTRESTLNDPTRERGSFTEYGPNSYNSSYNHQRYVALYRYPMTKLTDALNRPGVDRTKPLFTLKNTVNWTETWADGFTRSGSAESSLEEEAKIILPKRVGGTVTFDKNHGGYNRVVSALQSIIADGGTDLPMDGGVRNNTYYMYANFQADGNAVQMRENGSYSVPEGRAVLRDDGEYYLYTLKHNNVNAPLSGDLSTPLSTETPFKESDTRVYKLKEDDFYYDTVSISTMEIYDVEKANGPAGYAPTGKVRTDYTGYKPIELWIRKRGSSTYEKYGTFQATDSRQFSFTPEPGYQVVTNYANNSTITDSNYIDLEKSFSEKIAGLEFRAVSDSYQMNLKTKFGIKYTPTKEMRKVFQDSIAMGESGKYNFIAGPGYGKGSQGGKAFEGRLGQNWNYVGFTYTPISLYSRLYKNVQSYEDSPATSEQLVKTLVQIQNNSTIPVEYREDKYVSPYLLREGIIYDLLPAGTYVDPKEIALGPSGSYGTAYDDFQQGKDYTVEMIPNWENSGQTMMKIIFKTPKGSKTLDWKRQGQSYIRLYYVIHNPYTNIVDRGTIHQNTVGFVNTSKETKWLPNFNPEDKEKNIPAQKTNKLKEPYFRKIMEEAWNSDESHYQTTSIADIPVNFGAITVLQAAFTNMVSTEIHKPFLKENVSYMGDPYQHRLMYQSESVTRTTDTIIFDILGEEKDRNGDFAGIDVSSLLSKRSFKKGLRTENPDTLEPEVYYATVIPTKEQRDLGAPKYDAAAYANDANPNNPKNPGSIWKKWDVKNPEKNAGIDKSQIKAIAIDARTTKAGERFILDYQGLLIANVQMTATQDMKKLDIRNTNTAFRTGIMFQGEDVPASALPIELEAPSYHTIIKPVVLSIPVKKEMEVQEGFVSPNIKNAFKFTLTGGLGSSLVDEAGRPIVTEKTNPDADGGLMEFGKIRILRPGVYTYTVKESGKLPGIVNDSVAEKNVIITVENPDDKALTYTSSLEENKPLVFTNYYGAEELYADISVKKVLEHYGGLTVPDITDKFSFTLTALNGAPMPQEAGSGSSLSYTNPDKDGGEIVFGPIPYTVPGEYKYTVKEEGTVDPILNDPVSTKNITVTVRDLGNGTMSATVSGDKLEFRNVLPVNSVEDQLSFGKKIKGEEQSKKDKKDLFSFTLAWQKTELAKGGNAGIKLPTNLAPMPGNKTEKSMKISVEGEGTATFDAISFPAPGKYSYELKEDVLNLGGYRFDKSRYQVVFTVEEDPDEALKLLVKKEIFKDGSPIEEIIFVNELSKPNRPGVPPTPIKPLVPTGPGGPGEKPSLPETPTPPTEIPVDPVEPGSNIPPTPSPVIPRTRAEVERRIGEILGKNRPPTPEEEEELKKLGEVLGELRERESRATKTGDNSALGLYGIFAGLSAMLLGLYMALKKRFSR